jgi:general secretion pathway protein G
MMLGKTFTILFITAALSITSCHAARSQYDKSELLARETVLRDILHYLRESIDLYAADRGELPQSLDDLVKVGYVREIPVDPMTGSKDWKVLTGDDPNGKGRKGIADVHSSSTGKSTEGTLYSEW